MNNNDQKCLIKAKIEVSIKKKKQIRFVNLKAFKVMGVLTNVKFEAKVSELLDL